MLHLFKIIDLEFYLNLLSLFKIIEMDYSFLIHFALYLNKNDIRKTTSTKN